MAVRLPVAAGARAGFRGSLGYPVRDEFAHARLSPVDQDQRGHATDINRCVP